MDNFQRVGYSQPGFILGESVQSLQDGLDVALSK
jgi:hypothetical protein